MPNAITLAQQFVPILDEIYKLASLTSKLDGNPDLVRAGANANELIIPKLSMQGLGAYSRNSGYVSGDVTLTNETVTCNFDRGRMFTVDTMDNLETAGIAFGRLSGEFIRTKVVPELDAFRFAKYCGIAGISTVAGAVLATGADVIAALRAATNKMDEDEVPYDYAAVQGAVNAQLEPAAPQETTYTVQPGDTLWGIAQQYGTTVAALANHNDITDTSLIYTGQEIRIPR